MTTNTYMKKITILFSALLIQVTLMAQIPTGRPPGAAGGNMNMGHFYGKVVDANKKVVGVFTDGDLRRLVEKGADLRALTAAQVMHPNPRTLKHTALAVEAAELMEEHRITSVLVVDAHEALCGAINSNDLMRAKVI